MIAKGLVMMGAGWVAFITQLACLVPAYGWHRNLPLWSDFTLGGSILTACAGEAIVIVVGVRYLIRRDR